MSNDPIKNVATPPRDGPREYEGGSQPVRERPPEVPGPGRGAMQIVVLAIAAMVVLGALMWLVR
ncbi:MAG: hypothetical protein JWM27_3861 [Gemmatimonadetes bacterium]|jgi:hypothetical protein|nr:hypothetical protein [Gemmatimonadota bacterium]